MQAWMPGFQIRLLTGDPIESRGARLRLQALGLHARLPFWRGAWQIPLFVLEEHGEHTRRHIIWDVNRLALFGITLLGGLLAGGMAARRTKQGGTHGRS